MRLPRLRFTVRGMMVAVAIVGLYLAYLVELSGSSVMKYTSWEEAGGGTCFATMEVDTPFGYATRVIAWLTLPPVGFGLCILFPIALSETIRRHPRFPVAPDPPEPE